MKNNFFEPGTNRWIAPFLLIASGQVLSLVGTQLVQFSIVWWITKSTGSATTLATASMIALLPGIILGPFIGTLVDRWNRRWTMIIADSISAIAMGGMVYLFWSGNNQIWKILIIIFIRAVANSFHWPAMQASMTLMVPKQHYPRVQGLNQMVMGIMMISAAPLGALLLDLLPIYGVLAIDIVTAIIAIVPLLLISLPQPKRSPPAEGETGRTTVLQEFRQGLRYVFGWPGMVIFMVMVALINLLSTPASSLLPLMVTKYFLGRALQLAWLQAAFGIGTILGGILLGIWGGFKRRIVTTLVGLVSDRFSDYVPWPAAAARDTIGCCNLLLLRLYQPDHQRSFDGNFARNRRPTNARPRIYFDDQLCRGYDPGRIDDCRPDCRYLWRTRLVSPGRADHAAARSGGILCAPIDASKRMVFGYPRNSKGSRIRLHPNPHKLINCFQLKHLTVTFSPPVHLKPGKEPIFVYCGVINADL